MEKVHVLMSHKPHSICHIVGVFSEKCFARDFIRLQLKQEIDDEEISSIDGSLYIETWIVDDLVFIGRRFKN